MFSLSYVLPFNKKESFCSLIQLELLQVSIPTLFSRDTGNRLIPLTGIRS